MIKYFVISCILLVYCGVVFGFAMEFATAENSDTRFWTGWITLALLLVPSIAVALVTGRRKGA